MSEENFPPAWMLSRAAYQSRKGVHQPWACEVSPSQYAGMSKRARRLYDARRKEEWDASAACAREYADECLAAHDADPTILADPSIHPEAADAIRLGRRWRKDSRSSSSHSAKVHVYKRLTGERLTSQRDGRGE